MIAEEKLQAAARAVHETLNGKGTWNSASKQERSGARHLVRVMLVAVNFDLLDQDGVSHSHSVVSDSELNPPIADVSVPQAPEGESDVGSLTDAPVPPNLKPFSSLDRPAMEAALDSRLQLRRR